MGPDQRRRQAAGPPGAFRNDQRDLLESEPWVIALIRRIARDYHRRWQLRCSADDFADDVLFIFLTRRRDWLLQVLPLAREQPGRLYSPIHDACVDIYRKYQRRGREVPWDFQDHEDIAPAPDATKALIEEEARKAEIEKLRSAIRGLPDEEREVVELHCKEQTLNQIAQALGITVDKVRGRLGRAFARLKRQLSEI